jgi:hypothetical protein
MSIAWVEACVVKRDTRSDSRCILSAGTFLLPEDLEDNEHLRSALCVSIGLFGPFHSLAGAFDMDHKRASSLAVATEEFLVQQKIMIGFMEPRVAMISESLVRN